MKLNYNKIWHVVNGVLMGLGIGLAIAVVAFLAIGFLFISLPEWKAKQIGQRVDAFSAEEWRALFVAAEELHARTYRGKSIRVRPEDQPQIIRNLGFPSCRVEKSSLKLKSQGGGFEETIAWVGVFFGGDGDERGIRFIGYRRHNERIPME